MIPGVTTQKRFAGLVAWLLVVGIFALSVGTHALAQESPQYGGVLKFGLIGTPNTLDPHVYSASAHAPVKGLIYNSLLRPTPSGELAPDLASRWTINSDTSITFFLREGVVFHDGSPFTSDDVLFTFERILRPDSNATQFKLIDSIVEEVKALGDYAVEIRLKGPYAPILELLSRPELAIVSRQFELAGGDYSKQANGTGPFRLVEAIPDVRYVFERNSDYFKPGLPYLDGVEVYVMPDADSRVNGLLSGELDMIHYVPPQWMATFEQDSAYRYWGGYVIPTVALFNPYRPPMDDPLVRLAIVYAIDKEAVVQARDGRGLPLNGGLIPPGTWAFDTSLVGARAYNPERARELLAQAGYPNGLTIEGATVDLPHIRIPAEVVQAQLREVGIDLKLQLVELATGWDILYSGDYQMYFWGMSSLFNDPDFLTDYFITGDRWARAVGFHDEQLSNLLDRARTSYDPSERAALYSEVEAYLLDLAPWAYILNREEGAAAKNYVRGYEMLPGFQGYISELMLEQVWLEK